MLLTCLRREALVVAAGTVAEVPFPIFEPEATELLGGNPGTLSVFSSLLRSLRPLAAAACSSAANKAAVIASLLLRFVDSAEASEEAIKFPVLSTVKLDEEACSNT